MTDNAGPRVWGVVPAAGVGRRLPGPAPKQYLRLLGRSAIDWSVGVLLASPRLAGVVVAIGAEDTWWSSETLADHPRVRQVTGGPERADSVLRALRALADDGAAPGDRVVVHDAVRPCLAEEDLERLLAAGLGTADGALLAVPVSDTLKRSTHEGRVDATVPREHLWHAQTPQMFPLADLIDALAGALRAGVSVSDEAQAMERAGRSPRLVQGATTNLKITRPGDRTLVEAILRAQHPEEA